MGFREAEIEELKSQLGRMREDWIEEECHRVEAQLALKEARKEIKQLRQVVETMKNSLMEKDKGIQKYFIDINIQNRKLESLLHSMELAQNGCNLQDEPTLDFICESPESSTAVNLEMELHGEEQAVEEMADSELLANDEMANRAEILEKVLMSTAVDSSQDGGTKIIPQPGLSTLEPSVLERAQRSISQATPLMQKIKVSRLMRWSTHRWSPSPPFPAAKAPRWRLSWSPYFFSPPIPGIPFSTSSQKGWGLAWSTKTHKGGGVTWSTRWSQRCWPHLHQHCPKHR